MALSPLLDPLIRLRLRGSPRRLGQRTQDATPRQLDLEVVVAEAVRVSQHGLSCTQEIFARGRRSVELRYGLTVAQRLVRDAAERQARLLDRVALDLEADRDGYQGERIRQAIADLQIGIVVGEAFGRQFDRRDDLVRS